MPDTTYPPYAISSDMPPEEARQQLIDTLLWVRDVSPTAFAMCVWGSDYPGPDNVCGTAHCIAGWALLIHEDYLFYPHVQRTDDGYVYNYDHVVTGAVIGDHGHVSAVAEAIGLSYDDAEELFTGDLDISIDEAISALKDLPVSPLFPEDEDD